MSGKASILFKPLRIGDVTITNRITMAAMTRSRSEGTYPTDLMKEYYVQRAGAGLIVSEGILIARQGTMWPRAPGIWDDKHVEGWKSITDAVHQAGGRMYAQLWHVGRVAHPDMPQQKLAGTPVYAPSAVAARGGKFRSLPGAPGYVTPTAIDDPRKLIDQFKLAAANAKKAGFDGVELQGGNGYLVHQFLDSTSNHRSDQWGGSKENRIRFALEAIKALQEVFGRNVAVKVTPAGGYNDMGMPLQETLDTYKYYFSELDNLRLAYINLIRYTPGLLDPEIDGVPRGIKHDVLSSYRPFIKNTPLILNSGVRPDEGAELLASGQIDAIGIGFNFITHPDLVKRVEHGKALDNVLDFKHIHTDEEDTVQENWVKGYTDYPVAIH